MNRELTLEDQDCWRQLVQAENAALAARRILFTHRESLVELIRRGTHDPAERAVAIETAARLAEEELKQLVPDLLALASFGHGLTTRCQELLLRLPRPWLLAHLEGHAAPLLSEGGYEEYRALLHLFAQVDLGLARRWAERALQNSDPDIQEAGEDLLHGLDKLTKRLPSTALPAIE